MAKATAPTQAKATGPLTAAEQADYQALEKQAAQGRFQPNPQEMFRLSAFRERLKGKPQATEQG
jgi:hypothetical protein